MPSTVIRSYKYNALSSTLQITFVSGAIYNYLQVPLDVYLQMKDAFSKGTFFNQQIKDRYDFVKIKEADD